MFLFGKWPWGKEREFSKKELARILTDKNLEYMESYSWGVDRISKILFHTKSTRFAKYVPGFYSKITYPIRKFIKQYFPVNIGLVFKKI